jgi:hypothetical protein
MGVIVSWLLVYIIPSWLLNRHEKAQLRLKQQQLEKDKEQFTRRVYLQETFDKAHSYMNEAISAYKKALTGIDKAKEIREQTQLVLEKLTKENRQLRYELENSRERTKRLARKLAATSQPKNFQPDIL